MDEDHLLDIYDYFKESTTDKIDDALDELGDDFTKRKFVWYVLSSSLKWLIKKAKKIGVQVCGFE